MTLDDLRTLTVEQVAEVLGVHIESIRRWVREGDLAAARWGGRFHITVDAVRQFQEVHRVRIADPRDTRRPARRPDGAAPVRP